MSRFIIEGTWEGRVVHRTTHLDSAKRLREFAERAGAITFNDGTQLQIAVHDCKPNQRVETVPGYTKLIMDCMFHGVKSVAELPKVSSEGQEV